MLALRLKGCLSYFEENWPYPVYSSLRFDYTLDRLTDSVHSLAICSPGCNLIIASGSPLKQVTYHIATLAQAI